MKRPAPEADDQAIGGHLDRRLEFTDGPPSASAGPRSRSRDLLLPGGASAIVGGGLFAVAALALSLLSVRMAHRDGPTRLDAWFDPHVVDHLSAGVLVVIVDVLEYGVPVLVICFALTLAYWCWRTGHRRAALLAAAGPVLSVVSAEILKRVVLRTEGGVLGFPSGLSAGVTAEAVSLAVLLCGRDSCRRLRRTTRGWLWIMAFVCWAGLNSVIVVTRYHYVTDVAGSCLLAVVVVIAAAYGLDQVWLGSWQTDRSAPDPLHP